MAKIVIIAPTDADDDVKDAVKLLRAAGHDVDTEEPTPKSLLHIVLGLMGPSAYGFGPGYAYTPGADAADDAPADDADVDFSADDTGDEDLPADDEFRFESLGQVKVDGELIEAVTIDADTSVLCVQNLNQGIKTTYTLNESKFSFWPEYSTTGAAVQRVDIIVGENRTAITVPLATEGDKPVLKVGRDLLNLFKK